MKKLKKIFVLDTSVILHSHDSIMNFEENDIGIPITVLEELDEMKKGNDTKNFEAREFNRISEADLKDSLDKDEQKEKENLDSELSPQEERLLIDFQLSRAVDLIKGLSIYKESLIE